MPTYVWRCRFVLRRAGIVLYTREPDRITVTCTEEGGKRIALPKSVASHAREAYDAPAESLNRKLQKKIRPQSKYPREALGITANAERKTGEDT